MQVIECNTLTEFSKNFNFLEIGISELRNFYLMYTKILCLTHLEDYPTQ